MDSLLDFLAANVCILFFANGLALFTMGLAIALESRSTNSTFAMSKSLPSLAAFGLIASLGNWVQMLHAGLGQNLLALNSPFVQALKLICFVLSTLFLLEFGVRLAISHDARYRWLRTGFWALPVVYMGAVAAVLPAAYASGGDWVSVAEVRARVLLYFPALGLASLTLLAQRSDFVKMKLANPAPDALGAGLAFGLKMLASGLAAVPILALSEPVAATWVLPLQLVRTLTTVAIAYFVVRILRVFEIERRRQLDLAIQERFQVQEEALAAQEQTCDEIQRWSASMADMVHTVSSAISQPTSLEETMQIVLRETIGLAGLESGAVFLLDEENMMLRLVAHEALPDWVADHLTQVKVGDGLAGWVAKEGELLILDDIAHDPRPFVPRSEEVVKFYAGVPLKAHGDVVGVMNVSSSKPHELSAQQIALLVAVGQQLGVAIENSRLYQRIRYLATTEERSRLAREIHDNLSQLLGYLNLKAASAEQLLAEGQIEQARDSVREVKRIAQDAYTDARETIFSLRATTSGAGLLPALKEYLADYHTYYGLRSDLSIDDPSLAEFSANTEIQISCIIQEALTNVRKHAGATRVWLRFEPHGSGVRIVIRDDGRGFDPEQTRAIGGLHFGLAIMRERAESVGGRLELNSRPGEGARVVVWVPRSKGN
jgi:signal transduction histidine kinase